LYRGLWLIAVDGSFGRTLRKTGVFAGFGEFQEDIAGEAEVAALPAISPTKYLYTNSLLSWVCATVFCGAGCVLTAGLPALAVVAAIESAAKATARRRVVGLGILRMFSLRGLNYEESGSYPV
jgi:hypothetical protein